MDTFVYRDRFDTKHLRLKINQIISCSDGF